MPQKVAPDLSHLALSPMPGLLISVAVTEGAEVKAGDELAVIEAMKMETGIHAERGASIKTVHVGPGDQIDAKDLLVELD